MADKTLHIRLASVIPMKLKIQTQFINTKGPFQNHLKIMANKGQRAAYWEYTHLEKSPKAADL